MGADGMSSEAKQQLEAFRVNVKKQAEEVINKAMPAKVIELTAVIDEAALFKQNPDDIVQSFDWAEATSSADAEGARKKRKLESHDNGQPQTPKFADTVPCNQAIKHFHTTVLKPEVRRAIECANAVKVWIQLNIPQISTGDNFGVEVQQEALEEFTRAENSGLTILDQMMKYYCNRAKLTSKVLKYPNVHDYRQAIIELDTKEQLATKLCIMDVRNTYATLHDVVMKNYEKLVEPRHTTRQNQFY